MQSGESFISCYCNYSCEKLTDSTKEWCMVLTNDWLDLLSISCIKTKLFLDGTNWLYLTLIYQINIVYGDILFGSEHMYIIKKNILIQNPCKLFLTMKIKFVTPIFHLIQV